MGIVNRFVPENKLNEGLDSKISVPQPAEVGQTIVVEEIDENGKPTKWSPGKPDYTANEVGAIAETFANKITLLDEKITIPADSPITVLEFDLSKDVSKCNHLFLKIIRSKPTNEVETISTRFMMNIFGTDAVYYNMHCHDVSKATGLDYYFLDLQRALWFKFNSSIALETNMLTTSFNRNIERVKLMDKTITKLELKYFFEYAGDMEILLEGWI